MLNSVRQAEKELNEMHLDHEYSSIAGIQQFIDRSVEFVYGKDSPALKSGRVAAIQTLSGTGAGRIAGEFLATFFGRGKKIYVSEQTVSQHAMSIYFLMN